jgi:F0F1-type ATP synthase assembly protein I
MAHRLTHRLAADTPHRRALALVTSEAGFMGLVIVVVTIGLGVLLDFVVLNIHPVLSVGLLGLGVPASLYWTVRRALMSSNRTPTPEYLRNMALATVAGQAGCLTLVLVFAALFGGLYLDSHLDTHPIFTIGLVLLSIPVSLYSMVRLVLSAVARITPSQPRQKPPQEPE